MDSSEVEFYDTSDPKQEVHLVEEESPFFFSLFSHSYRSGYQLRISHLKGNPAGKTGLIRLMYD